MTDRSAKIAAQNDAFRKAFGPCLHAPEGQEEVALKGWVFITPGVEALPVAEQRRLVRRVRGTRRFHNGNNPYGQRDFLSLRVRTNEGVRHAYFKIDYYADGRLIYGSDDPANPEKTYRVGTLLMASEY